jgi:hypothetical protein
MIYGFSLPGVGFTVGTALIGVHLFALIRQREVIPWLQKFPRSKFWGVALCSMAAVWAFWMAATMDLGEFSPNRTLICGVILAGAFMVPVFADEFLSVRATGILALLAAEPLLEAAFLRPEQTRLLLVVLAYPRRWFSSRGFSFPPKSVTFSAHVANCFYRSERGGNGGTP